MTTAACSERAPSSQQPTAQSPAVPLLVLDHTPIAPGSTSCCALPSCCSLSHCFFFTLPFVSSRSGGVCASQYNSLCGVRKLCQAATDCESGVCDPQTRRCVCGQGLEPQGPFCTRPAALPPVAAPPAFTLPPGIIPAPPGVNVGPPAGGIPGVFPTPGVTPTPGATPMPGIPTTPGVTPAPGATTPGVTPPGTPPGVTPGVTPGTPPGVGVTHLIGDLIWEET